MTASKLLPALLALAVPMSAMSCDGDADPNAFTQADFPLCDQRLTMRLVGTVDDMSIDVTLPGGGGFGQGNDGGDFQFDGSLTSDPADAEAEVRLSWDRFIATGVVTDARGTLRLVEGPFAGESFCAGAGTRIRLPGDETVIQFELAGLGSGDGCSIARAGRIKGCVR
jgi:hypothetical protein